MSPADNLLGRLDGVRQRGPGQWSARCPAHKDRSPSLSIRERDDGALLLKCWAGCSVAEIVGSVGLQLQDLFPPKPQAAGGGAAPSRRPWTAAQLLDLAAFESTVAAVICCDIVEGRKDSIARLLEAASRLGDIAHASR